MFYIGFRDVNNAQIGIARSKDRVSDSQWLPYSTIITPKDQWDADTCYKQVAV